MRLTKKEKEDLKEWKKYFVMNGKYTEYDFSMVTGMYRLPYSIRGVRVFLWVIDDLKTIKFTDEIIELMMMEID